jgi:hypothetical protein
MAADRSAATPAPRPGSYETEHPAAAARGYEEDAPTPAPIVAAITFFGIVWFFIGCFCIYAGGSCVSGNQEVHSHTVHRWDNPTPPPTAKPKYSYGDKNFP